MTIHPRAYNGNTSPMGDHHTAPTRAHHTHEHNTVPASIRLYQVIKDIQKIRAKLLKPTRFRLTSDPPPILL